MQHESVSYKINDSLTKKQTVSLEQSSALVVRCTHRPCSWYHMIPRDAHVGLTALQMQYNFLFVSYPCQEGWRQPEGMSPTLQSETDVTGSCAELRRGINLPSYGSMEAQPQLVEGAASRVCGKRYDKGIYRNFRLLAVFRSALGST
jgi:hypothetical protein